MKNIFKKIFSLPIFVLLMIIQSCVTIETDMKVNKNLTGSSTSKISVAKGLITEEQLKIEIEKLGFKKYTLKKEKTSDNDTDKYTVAIDWKTDEELKNILKFTGSGPVLGMSEVKEGVEKLTEGLDKNTEKDTKNNTKNSTSTDVFTKDKGNVIVNMGTTNISKLTIKVDGKIINEENQIGKISDKNDEIIFYQGQNVQFKYKEKGGFFGLIAKLFVLFVIIILALLGYFFIKKVKNNKSKNRTKHTPNENVKSEDTTNNENIETKDNTDENNEKVDTNNTN